MLTGLFFPFLSVEHSFPKVLKISLIQNFDFFDFFFLKKNFKFLDFFFQLKSIDKEKKKEKNNTTSKAI